MNEYSLTPVQEVDGLRIKRDDLYAPFGPGEVNGGKLRQCVMLVNSVSCPTASNWAAFLSARLAGDAWLPGGAR